MLSIGSSSSKSILMRCFASFAASIDSAAIKKLSAQRIAQYPQQVLAHHEKPVPFDYGLEYLDMTKLHEHL
jgi:hypothetical protein